MDDMRQVSVLAKEKAAKNKQKWEKTAVAEQREIAKKKLVEMFAKDNIVKVTNKFFWGILPSNKKELLGEPHHVPALKKAEAEMLANAVLRAKEVMTKDSYNKPKRIRCGINKTNKIVVVPYKKDKMTGRYESDSTGISHGKENALGAQYGDYIPVIEKIVKPYGAAMKKLMKTD